MTAVKKKVYCKIFVYKRTIAKWLTEKLQAILTAICAYQHVVKISNFSNFHLITAKWKAMESSSIDIEL